MKVLQVNTASGWRGGERQTFLTMRGLKRESVNVSLLCLNSAPLYKKAKTEGFRVIGVNNQLTALRYLLNHGSEFDILHPQTAKAFSLCAISKWKHNTKIVYTRRVDFVPKGFLTKWKYRQADHLVGISDAIIQILHDFGFNDCTKIFSAIEEKSLNISRATSLKDKLNINTKKIVATTAAFVPHKDPLTMVKAIHELSKRRDDFVMLHFGDGPLKSQIMEYINHHNLQSVYLLPGFFAEVEDFFSIFDVFVMSSNEEGLGSSVLDAFLYEVPVVSTSAGGLKELVKDRGELCPIGDYQCIAQKIDNLLNNNELAKKFISAAKSYVLAHHSVKNMTDQYLTIYKKLTEEHHD
ncbi:MAG: glycosyltransferase family 4 protein [Calditrichia bacterium]